MSLDTYCAGNMNLLTTIINAEKDSTYFDNIDKAKIEYNYDSINKLIYLNNIIEFMYSPTQEYRCNSTQDIKIPYQKINLPVSKLNLKPLFDEYIKIGKPLYHVSSIPKSSIPILDLSIKFGDEVIESHELSAFNDLSKYATTIKIGSNALNALNAPKPVNVKIVNFDMDICPVELKPVAGKCPEKFPVLNSRTDCCHKNIALKEGLIKWKKDHGIKITDVYIPDLEMYAKRHTFIYNSDQTDSIAIYTYHGDRLMSNYTTNGFKINKELLTYYNLVSKSLHIRGKETLSEYCQRFYKTLVSSFIYPAEKHMILYRGVKSDKCGEYLANTFIMINHFMSSSIDESVAVGFAGLYKPTILIIYVPQGTAICPVFDLSLFKREKEVLLNCGSIFYINNTYKKSNGDTCYIEMTLVGRRELNPL